MAFLLEEEQLTLDSILFCFGLGGGSFCFGGCFGKNSLYKLIFVVLVFKAKNKKTKTNFW